MRDRLDRIVEWAFPGMGVRPLYLGAYCAWSLVLYHHHSGPGSVPPWFVDRARALFGVADPVFYDHLWSHSIAIALLLALPLAIAAIFERWSPLELGLRARGIHVELGVVLVLWLVMIPIVWAIHDAPAFAAMYPRLPSAKYDPQVFVLYEGLYLLKWIAWEFFFRGFMLLGLGRDFGGRAALISTIPYVLMHYGKPELEMASAMIAGLVLCFVALRSRSIWPGVLLHSLVATTLDFFAAQWWRA